MALPQISSQPPRELEAAVPVRRAAGAPRRGAAIIAFWHILRHNRKAMVGFSILVFFGLVAFIGPYLAPYNPVQIGVGGPGESPSFSHWLGTTRLGQDI